MKHEDVYTKFMIEYDKANVLSSYPSLTEYEVATFLDKAYNALIAQKVTGNNVRRTGFETDVKVIEDLSPLITQKDLDLYASEGNFRVSSNTVYANLPKEEYMYFVSAFLDKELNIDTSTGKVPMDRPATKEGPEKRAIPVQLVSHQMALKFRSNSYNKPWIKIPIGYIETDKLYITCDPFDTNDLVIGNKCHLTYIRKPNTFVKDLSDRTKFSKETGVYDYFKPSEADADNPYYVFECNDTMVEELISLAIAYALENIESARLNTKLNLRGLEA